MPTTATQRKALEQRQATTRKAIADRRKFLHRMRNKVHQYTGIDMRDQELVRLERENRDVKQALDALYRQERQASAATKSKVATKRSNRTRGRRRGRSSGSTSSRKQLVLGLVLAVAGALAVVNRETIREKWREWLNQQQQGSETSTKDNNSRFPSSSTQRPRRQNLHTLSKVTLRFMGPYNTQNPDRNTSTTAIAEYLQQNHIKNQLVCYSANAKNCGPWYKSRLGGTNQANGADRLHQMYGVEAGDYTSKTVEEAYNLIKRSLNELFKYAIQNNIDTIWHPGTQSSSTYYGGTWTQFLPDPGSYKQLMNKLEAYFEQSPFTIVDFNTLGSKKFFDMHSSSSSDTNRSDGGSFVQPKVNDRWTTDRDRCHHLNMRTVGLGDAPSSNPDDIRRTMYAGLRMWFSKCAQVSVQRHSLGTANVAFDYQKTHPIYRLGIMIAGNSGRPGGDIGKADGTVQKVHAEHRTQEEDLVSSWLVGEAGNNTRKQNKLYKDHLWNRWGMMDMNSTSPHTRQGVDYTKCSKTEYAQMYADAWTINRASLCTKRRSGSFNFTETFGATLVFVAGPNMGAGKSPHGSTARTLLPESTTYDIFKEGVTSAVRTGLDAMVMEGVQVAFIAQVSCGLYAGKYKTQIRRDFENLVNGLLHEYVGRKQRGNYFKDVILVKL